MHWQAKLSAAQLRIFRRWKYFRAAVVTLRTVETPGLGTIGVTKNWVLMVDPKVVDEWETGKLVGVLLHEVSHPLRGHFDRAKAIGAGKDFNIDADLEINPDILAMGAELPEGVLMPAQYGLPVGLTAEEYHSRRKAKQQEQQDEQSKGEGSQSSDKQSEDGQSQSSNAQGSEGQGEGQDSSAPRPCAGHCGSAAGNELPGEAEAEAQAGGGVSKAQIESVRKQVAQAIRDEVASKGAGSVAGGWARWAEVQLAPPTVNWQSRLARLCRLYVARKAGAVDTSFHRPSRRQAGIGYGLGVGVMPAYFAPVPKTLIVADTSMSMGKREIGQVVSESSGILKAVGADVTFMAADAAVQTCQRVKSVRELLPLLKGGGGTSFIPAFEAIDKMPRSSRPSIVVYITDGCGSAPYKSPAGIQTIWVLVGTYRQHPAPWGEFIEVDK
jgi:predicted metal-dependent peptidase